MLTNELDWERIQTKAPHVARQIGREYPGIDPEDIEQEIYLHCAENARIVANYADTALEKVMQTAGRKYANRERYAFIHTSAEWIYTPREVRALFEEAFFNRDMWQNMPQKDDGVSITAKNVVVSLWDISNAFDSLNTAEKAALVKRYNYGMEFSDDTERKACNRAIDKVTQKINGRMALKTKEHTQ